MVRLMRRFHTKSALGPAWKHTNESESYEGDARVRYGAIQGMPVTQRRVCTTSLVSLCSSHRCDVPVVECTRRVDATSGGRHCCSCNEGTGYDALIAQPLKEISLHPGWHPRIADTRRTLYKSDSLEELTAFAMNLIHPERCETTR